MQRQEWFGTIEQDKMLLSSAGTIVAEEWQRTEVIRPYVGLDNWVVMPNHFHGIIVLNSSTTNTNSTTEPVPDQEALSSAKQHTTLRAGSLGAIVGQFKSVVTKRIWASGTTDFRWQARFHDKLIRDERALNSIRDYILKNPQRWSEDRNRIPDIWM